MKTRILKRLVRRLTVFATAFVKSGFPKVLLAEAIFSAGIACTVFAAWLVSEPCGWAAMGVWCLAAGITLARSHHRTPRG